MLSELIVSSTAEVSELLEVGCGLVPTVDDIGHISGQHKWGSIPIQEHMRNEKVACATLQCVSSKRSVMTL